MKYLFVILFFSILSGCSSNSRSVSLLPEDIKAYCIDFNSGPAGLWAEADPQQHIQWYEDLGCNVVQTFAVSQNGYSWYKNGVIPEQPGLKYDFLTEMVRLGHQKNMKVFGYYNASANFKWGTDHPDMSYEEFNMRGSHIPFTTQYLDYLCASISDAIRKTKMDGFMVDWIWLPGNPAPLKWLACEQEMFVELMDRPFPGIDNIKPEVEQEFRRKAINRCWRRIYDTTKQTNPDCLIWVTCSDVTSPDIKGSDMFREADIFMNEEGDVTLLEGIRDIIGPNTRLLTCLARWNRKDPKIIIPQAIKADIGLYGFTRPQVNSLMPPVSHYLSKQVDEFENADDRIIACFARIFNGLPLD